MRTLIALLIIFSIHHGQSQNLITRTLDGVSIQSTPVPNEIAKSLSQFKSGNEIQLFQYQERFEENNETYVSLKITSEGKKPLKNIDVTDVSISVPVSSDASFSLRLKRVQIFSPSFIIQDEAGNEVSPQETHTFRGIIDGDHGSLVSLSITNDNMHISISDRDGTYRVNYEENKPAHYNLYPDKSDPEVSVKCATTEDMILGNHQNIIKGGTRKSAGDIVEVYVECDYQLFINKGGVSGVSSYVTNLFNEVVTMYANENITIAVSDLMVWTNPDPYRGMSLNNVTAILDEFGSNTQNGHDGRLATLIVGRVPSGGGLGGVAWVDVLCDSYNPAWQSGPYSFNYGFGRFEIHTYPSYSLDVSIMTHELGHNFGSPHTHNCSWGPGNNRAIDNCPGFTEGGCGLVTNPTPSSELGTIMSYCNNIDFTKGFGSEPGALIYSRYVNAGCLVPGGAQCTDFDKVYSNTTVSTTQVLADNNITLNNTVNISNGASVFWQAENQFTINGTLTVPVNSILSVISDNCE